MNWVDILLILVVILAIIAGWYRGFIAGMLGLATWAGSFFIAYVLYPYAANVLDNLFNIGPWLLPISFLFIAIISGVLLSILAGFVLRSIPLQSHHSNVNRIMGVIPGAITGYLYAVILSAIVLALPIRDRVQKKLERAS
jgi:uncharacterized membrane protein required for colicin V production